MDEQFEEELEEELERCRICSETNLPSLVYGGFVNEVARVETIVKGVAYIGNMILEEIQSLKPS